MWRRLWSSRAAAAVLSSSLLAALTAAAWWRRGPSRLRRPQGPPGAPATAEGDPARRLLLLSQGQPKQDDEPHVVWVGGAYSGSEDPLTMEFCSLEGDCDLFGPVAPLPKGAGGAVGHCKAAGGTWCSTHPPLEDLFSPVDGGTGRACRRTNIDDNQPIYYHIKKLTTTASFAQCQGLCLAHEACTGVEHIEFRLEHRCEIWQQRIMATLPVSWASCLRQENWLKAPNCCLKGSCGACEKLGKLGSQDRGACIKAGGQWCEPASPWYGLFAPADGGVDRSCRGAEPWDNDPSYFEAHVLGVKDSIEQCKRLCIDHPHCKGIEYRELADGPRCEVWTRPAGIGAGKHSAGATCLRGTR
mmetsp:Transcript_79079/g.245619  ORF Transcript_79079/g.245619 Transcript_79079/m.245619 type:complete len:357 (-) Transcript_79079:5-1075(-)